MTFFLPAIMVVLLTTAGQIFLKKAALNREKMYMYLILGYSVFLLVVFSSFVLMHYIELKYFTVIMSSSYLSVMFASAYFFKERLDSGKLAGTTFVVIGAIVFVAPL